MTTYKQLYNQTFAGPVTWSYWFGEVKELWVEIKNLNISGIREEWSDVTCLLGVKFLAKTNAPILPGLGLYAANKFIARIKEWEKIFAANGLEFKKEFIIGGSNYQKPEKVQKALQLAKAST